MSRLRVVIVDDERLARAELRRLLAVDPQVEIVGEAEDADAALALIRDVQPDLAFLDIQMPGTNGLQLAADLDSACQFVFCTAFDSFAIDAFGLNALDYLDKPVVPERLAQSLSRARSSAPPRGEGKPRPPTLPMEHPLLQKQAIVILGDKARERRGQIIAQRHPLIVIVLQREDAFIGPVLIGREFAKRIGVFERARLQRLEAPIFINLADLGHEFAFSREAAPAPILKAARSARLGAEVFVRCRHGRGVLDHARPRGNAGRSARV